jgi:hypothetical protein
VGDFGTITFTAAGTYTFTFAEDSYTYPGITPVAGTTPTLVIEAHDLPAFKPAKSFIERMDANSAAAE